MRTRRILFPSVCILLWMYLDGGALFAQQPSNTKSSTPTEDVFFETVAPVTLPLENKGQIFERPVPPPGGVAWIASQMSFDATPVKGAPYSAEAVTESVQTLSDGNRIQHKNTASIFRDGEGRTRREQTLTSIGPWAAGGEPTQTVFINDPVSGVNYVLNTRDKTARKLPAPNIVRRTPTKGTATGGSPATPVQRTMVFSSQGHVVQDDVHQVEITRGPGRGAALGVAFAEYQPFNADQNQSEKQSLGKRIIEGVEAEGSRTTLTIPAGQVGNELPMQIVSERWFSPELQVLLMSKNSDPRMGESTYRLTNVSRAEQSRSLFEVPADYKIEEGPEPFLFHTAPDPASH